MRLVSRNLLLAGLVLASGCKAEVASETEILLTIESSSALDELVIRARDIDYLSDEISENVEGRDLRDEPFTILFQPSDAIDGEFFVYVQGRRGSDVIAANSVLLEFEKKKRVEVTLALTESWQDADDDGFPLCVGQHCDCNDTNPQVNPFTRERCDDVIDNNCSGLPINEGCGCNPDDPPVPCTGLPTSQLHKAGIGACYLGELRCICDTNGENCVLETECDAGGESEEVAGDFIDNNCDGTVDEGSVCGPSGTQRSCHRGFVDDNDLGNPEPTGASDRALGQCRDANEDAPYGVQTCDASGRWGDCLGDVLPQVNTSAGFGFIELPADTGAGVASQCDGLDNDCDGLYDEERFFDGDGDGYTQCGTVFDPDPDDPTQNAFGEPGRDAAFLDCNDGEAAINPGQTELCGNTVDEDCRCDHDSMGRPASDQNSQIGDPYNRLDAGTNCAVAQSYLNCAFDPRSDPNPSGDCRDGPVPYFDGVHATSGTGAQACFYCAAAFGQICSADLDCSSKQEDCDPCPLILSRSDTDVAELRPFCREFVDGTCTGSLPAAWQDIVGADPFEECAGLSCAGYYHSRGGPQQGQCFEKLDIAASEALCTGEGECDGLTAVACCDQAFELCALDRPAKTTPVPGALCSKVTGNCSGTTPPTFSAQAAGEDLFNECSSAFDCDDGSGNGPYYFGISGSPAHCFYRADVSNNACDGSDTCPDGTVCSACEDQDEACGAALQGAAYTRAGNTCRIPNGGCTGTTAPVFGASVTLHTDPYGECPGRGCCVDGCCALEGESCDEPDDCQNGICVDGVCCENDCDTACMACSNALTLAPNGQCEPMAFQNTDLEPAALCSGAVGGCGSGSCICEAGSGACEIANGSSCGNNDACASDHCECANSACTNLVCSPNPCTCDLENDGDGDCNDGFVGDTVDNDDDCAGVLTCNGAGACHVPDGGTCSGDAECQSNNCECNDNTCSTRRCAPQVCSCGFDTNGAGSCDGNLTSFTDDPEDCTGTTGCARTDCSCDADDGGCKGTNGVACTADAQCVSNNCECHDNTCSSRRCAPQACGCRYDTNGAGTCDGNLTSNTDDPEDCATTTGCALGDCSCDVDDAGCKGTNGQTCSGDAQCVSNNCECHDNTCSSRRCAPQACPCGFDTNGAGTCDGNLSNGTDDPEDCVNGTGCGASDCSCDTDDAVCRATQGQTCTGDGQCITGFCECTDSTCSSRRCAPQACPCGYDTNGAGTCDGNLSNGTDDPEDCFNAVGCSGADCSCDADDGACRTMQGQTCTGDGQCITGFCECHDNTCSSRRCAPQACPCGFDTNGAGTCDGRLGNAVDDPEDCAGAVGCAQSDCSCDADDGSCKATNTTACTGDSQCVTNNCECHDNTCSSRRCAPQSCACGFDTSGGGSCDGNLTSNTDDPEDCSGATGCSASDCSCDVDDAACKAVNGQTCTGDAECVSNNCECHDNTCSSRRCAPQACPCGFDTNGAGTCDGFLNNNTDDPEDCVNTTGCAQSDCSCDQDDGACRATNAQTCAADSQCITTNCECHDNTCSSRRCAPQACGCGFDTGGGGTCDGNLTSNTDDPEDCAGAIGCSAADCSCDVDDAACKAVNGQTCTADASCVSGFCECHDDTCSSRRCAPQACPCGYDTSGAGTCEGFLTNNTDDPGYCFDTTGCGLSDCSCDQDDGGCKGTTNAVDCAADNSLCISNVCTDNPGDDTCN